MTMLQCSPCCDWFHATCLGVSPTETSSRGLLVCGSCWAAPAFAWLHAYGSRRYTAAVLASAAAEADEESEGEPSASPSPSPSASPISSPPRVASGVPPSCTSVVMSPPAGSPARRSIAMSMLSAARADAASPAGTLSAAPVRCLLETPGATRERQLYLTLARGRGVVLLPHWERRICGCPTCLRNLGPTLTLLHGDDALPQGARNGGGVSTAAAEPTAPDDGPTLASPQSPPGLPVVPSLAEVLRRVIRSLVEQREVDGLGDNRPITREEVEAAVLDWGGVGLRAHNGSDNAGAGGATHGHGSP